MLIGIHAKALSETYPTGVGFYTRYLLQYLLGLPEAGTHRFLLYLAKNGADQYPANITKKILSSPFLWTQSRLAIELLLHKPDVFFVPQHVLPKTAPKNSAVTIHGLEFERFPDHYAWQERMYLRWVTRDAVKRASCIIAVSNATKQDLMEFYRLPEEKITVVHHGAPQRISNIKYPISNKRMDTPYFLYIGRIEKKKNVDGLIRAFTIAKEKYKLPHKLILAGSIGFGFSSKKLSAISYKLKNQIEFLGYISEEAKWELLRNAEAFVFPSWCEGFGLPILEAQQAGVPVITSNISAMPEVAGPGGLFIDPSSPESIAEAMHRISEDRKLRENLIAAGYKNAQRFSWEKCAQETLNILIKP